MGRQFDPYYTWLGIKPEDQPPHHYRLLGLEPLESDREVIVNAIDQRTTHVKSKLSGPHADPAREVLAKITAARICLLTPEKKEEYDTALRRGIGKTKPAEPAGPAKQKIMTAQPLPTAKPLTAAKPAAHEPSNGSRAEFTAPSAKPARKPRFKGEPQPAAPAPAAAKPAVAKPAAPKPAAPKASPGPQIVAEHDPRVRPRKRSSWLTPVALLLLLIIAAGAAVGVAYHKGYLTFGSPEVAANSADENGDELPTPEGPDAQPGENQTSGDDPAAAAASDDDTKGADPDDTADQDSELKPEDSPKTGDADDTAADVPDLDNLDKLTDEPWAGLFDNDSGTGEEGSPDDATGQSDADQANPTIRQTQRRPVPSPEKQDETKTAVRRIFHDEIAAARTQAAQLELAQKLISYADQTKKDAAARYTLLTLARDLAANAGETLLILDTVDALAREYEIDPLKMKSDAFQLAGKSAKSPEVLGGVSEGTRPLIADAVNRSRYEIAVELADMLHKNARRLRLAEMVTQTAVLLREINTRKVRYEFAQRAVETLKENPEDPEANLAIGRFLVLTKKDWKKGLPHLAKGSDDRLAEVANFELSELSDPKLKIALAVMWEKQAAANRGEEAESLYHRRAIHWYRQSLAELDGLERIAVVEKLEEMGTVVDLQTPTAPQPDAGQDVSAFAPRDDGNTSDADLLDAAAADPPDKKPPQKSPTEPPANNPADAGIPPKETAPKPLDGPGKKVEDFFGPRPPRQEEEKEAGDFFGD
jgi:hypothetical protein